MDDDGWVDRLLILHTSIGQEEGGNSNRIWSHFTTFDEVIDTEQEFIKKSDIDIIKEDFEDWNLDERLTEGDFHTHSMNFYGSLKLTYNYGNELLWY